MTSELQVLQAMRLKGMADIDILASATAAETTDLVAELDRLSTNDLCKVAAGRYRVTPTGRSRLQELLAAERETVDTAAISDAYHGEFDKCNLTFKQLITDWQVKDDQPNDHADGAYDAEVVSRLVELDSRFAPTLFRMMELLPRLRTYGARFEASLRRVVDGDHRWLARPLIDSYHTVWFELHEELIGLLGLTREEEAAAGRAQ